MNFVKKNIWLIVSIFVVIVIGFILFNIFRNGNYETVQVERKDLEKITEISGKVVPAQEIDLSFESRGKIIKLLKRSGQQVRAGEVIAEIDSLEVKGEIDEALALLRSENAKLSEITGNENGVSKVDVAKNNLIKTINKAYINSDDIIKNKVDVFFENPNSRFPEFSITLSNYFVREELNNKRSDINKILSTWQQEISKTNPSNFDYALVDRSITNLRNIEDYVSIITDNSYNFDVAGDITQAQIDAFLANVSQGRTTIASSIVEINSALENLRNIESEIPVQNAKVQNYEATVSKLESKINNYVIVAPFDGVITSKHSEIGQVVEGGESVYSVISNLPLQIEAFIPEISVVGVNVNDTVRISFDALGKNNFFDGVVSEVEPRETIKDGVVTYKVLVSLIKENSELKPGMSANLVIKKDIVAGQLVIPTYVVSKEEDKYFVNVFQNEKLRKTEIQILDKDNRGNYSVGGLIEKDLLIIPNK